MYFLNFWFCSPNFCSLSNHCTVRVKKRSKLSRDIEYWVLEKQVFCNGREHSHVHVPNIRRSHTYIKHFKANIAKQSPLLLKFGLKLKNEGK